MLGISFAKWELKVLLPIFSHSFWVQIFSFLFFPVAFYLPVALPLYAFLLTFILVGKPLFFLEVGPVLKRIVSQERYKILLLTPLTIFALLPFVSPLGPQIRFSVELLASLLILLLMILAKDYSLRHEKESPLNLDRYLMIGLACALTISLIDNFFAFRIMKLFTTRYASSIKFHKGLLFAILYVLLKAPINKKSLHWVLWMASLICLYFLTRLYDSDALTLGIFSAISAHLFATFVPYALGLFSVCFVIYLVAMPAFINFIINPSFFAQYIPIISYTWEHRLYSWQYFLKRICERPFLGWGPGASKHETFREMVGWHVNHYIDKNGRPSVVPTLNHVGQYQIEKHWLELQVSEYPHNFALQLWLEFGLIGILSISLLVFAIVYHIHKFRREEAARFVGLMVCLCAILSAGFNMWQKWLLAGMSVLVVFYDIHVKSLKE